MVGHDCHRTDENGHDMALQKEDDLHGYEVGPRSIDLENHFLQMGDRHEAE